jgi:hypothetical protein
MLVMAPLMGEGGGGAEGVVEKKWKTVLKKRKPCG